MDTYVITDIDGIVVDMLVNHPRDTALRYCEWSHKPRFLIHTTYSPAIQLRRPMPALEGVVEFIEATPDPLDAMQDEHRAAVEAAHNRLMRAEAAERSYCAVEARDARDAYNAALATALDAANGGAA